MAVFWWNYLITEGTNWSPKSGTSQQSKVKQWHIIGGPYMPTFRTVVLIFGGGEVVKSEMIFWNTSGWWTWLNMPCNCKLDQLTHQLYLSQTQYKALAVPFVGAGNTETASKTTIKVVPRLDLKYLFYLFTNFGINFEPQWIWNLHYWGMVENFWIIFELLNCKQIQNFDDVMSDPPGLYRNHCNKQVLRRLHQSVVYLYIKIYF